MAKTLLKHLLKYLAKKIIRKHNPDVIGITGSVGKSSVKEAIAAVLSSRFNVRKSSKNYNNEIGLPLTIIGFDQSPGRSLFGWLRIIGKGFCLAFYKDKNYPEMLVLEMGADKPGDISYLVDIAPCRVGVLTCIGRAHAEFFKTIKKIAQEKRIIISHLKQDGFAILNYDCDVTMQNVSATKAEVITYGFNDGADLRATDVNIITDEKTGWPTGLNFKLIYHGNVVPVFLPGGIAKPFILSALAGLAAGTVFGINLIEGAEALVKLQPLPGRMRLISGIKNTLIIDDSYNSSPEAAKSALDTLAQINIRQGGERYVVLGDMLELGVETETAHRELGFRVAEKGINYLVTVGEAGKFIAQAAREAGMPEHHISSFNDSESAGRFLQDKLEAGDILLVKGSQGSRMEKIVKELMAEPLLAPKLLARQDKGWQSK